MSKEIIYIYDALCGWCYGFGPVVQQLNKKYGAEIPFNTLSGGMITGSRVAPLANMAAYIEQAHTRVEELTGVKFGAAFLQGRLKDPICLSDSEPPAIALAVFKSFLPELSVDFAHDIQRSFYWEGQDLNELPTYLSLLSKYHLDESEFAARFVSPAFKASVLAEFAQLQHWGVTGFPELVYRDGDQLRALARGYRDFPSLDQLLESVLVSG